MLKGTSLEVQWLKFHASKAEDGVSISCWGTKVPHALWPKIGGKAEVLSFDISDSHILYSEALFTYNQWLAWPMELPRWHSGKEFACQCRRHGRCGFDPWVGKISWRRKWQPTPVFLPGKFHGFGGWRSTVHGVTKSQTWLSNWACTGTCTHTHTALSNMFTRVATECLWSN